MERAHRGVIVGHHRRPTRRHVRSPFLLPVAHVPSWPCYLCKLANFLYIYFSLTIRTRSSETRSSETIITMAEWSSMNRNGPAGVGDADTSHKTGLVPPLLRMFAPSRPIEYLKPMTSRRIKVPGNFPIIYHPTQPAYRPPTAPSHICQIIYSDYPSNIRSVASKRTL